MKRKEKAREVQNEEVEQKLEKSTQFRFAKKQKTLCSALGK